MQCCVYTQSDWVKIKYLDASWESRTIAVWLKGDSGTLNQALPITVVKKESFNLILKVGRVSVSENKEHFMWHELFLKTLFTIRSSVFKQFEDRGISCFKYEKFKQCLGRSWPGSDKGKKKKKMLPMCNSEALKLSNWDCVSSVGSQIKLQ